MTLERGSRDDTTARSLVSARFVLSSFPRDFSPSFLSGARSHPPRLLCLLLFLLLLLLLLLLLPLLSSESVGRLAYEPRSTRQLLFSALMSLLLFALLNAIRAYSMSLPPLLGTRATTSSFRLPRYTRRLTHRGARSRALTHVRESRRSSAAAFALTGPVAALRYAAQHARNTLTRKDVRVTRGIAPRGRRGHSNQPQTCIRTLLCNF